MRQPSPDVLPTDPESVRQRHGRDDWDASVATEGGARSGARGSHIESDKNRFVWLDTPLRNQISRIARRIRSLMH